MTSLLTWRELSELKPDALVAFGAPFATRTSMGMLDVPARTVCKIVENSMADYAFLIIQPVNPADREYLTYNQDKYDGCIVLDSSDGMPDDIDGDEPSPFILDDSCPVGECI